MAVMNEMQFLLFSKPGKSLQAGSLDMVFFVEKDVGIKRQRTGHCLGDKEVERQNQITQNSKEKNRNKKEWREVAFLSKILF